MNEKGSDHQNQTIPKAIPSHLEDRMERTIDELSNLDKNPEALNQRLDAAMNQATDETLGEVVGLISYGGNQLSDLLSRSGLDEAQCQAIRSQYDQLVNPENFETELIEANRIQEQKAAIELTHQANDEVDHRHEDYSQILAKRTQLYEEDITASKLKKEGLQNNLETTQGDLKLQKEYFAKDSHTYGLSPDKALSASDQELFNMIYAADFADKPEPQNDEEKDRIRESVHTRRDMLKARIAPLRNAQAKVNDIKDQIVQEDKKIEAGQQWIEQCKDDRRVAEEKYKQDKKSIKEGTYQSNNSGETLRAKARRMAQSDRSRDEVDVIFKYARLAEDSSQTLLQTASRNHLDRYEKTLATRMGTLTQGIQEFKKDDPQVAEVYEVEKQRLEGLLYKINPSKYSPPDLPMT